jgi:hypothetical protein
VRAARKWVGKLFCFREKVAEGRMRVFEASTILIRLATLDIFSRREAGSYAGNIFYLHLRRSQPWCGGARNFKTPSDKYRSNSSSRRDIRTHV